MPNTMTPTERKRHQAERRKWAAVVKAGNATCCYCGRVLEPDGKWHLAHDHRAGDGYLGSSCVRCNIAERNKRVNPRIAAEARAYREGRTATSDTERHWSRDWTGEKAPEASREPAGADPEPEEAQPKPPAEAPQQAFGNAPARRWARQRAEDALDRAIVRAEAMAELRIDELRYQQQLDRYQAPECDAYGELTDLEGWLGGRVA